MIREQHPNLNVWTLKLQHLKINIVSVFEVNTGKEMVFSKDFLRDLGAQNPPIFFGRAWVCKSHPGVTDT